MARLVVPESGRARLAANKLDDNPADKYKERLIKYIPVESIAFYVFVDKMLASYYGIDFAGTVTERPADQMMQILSIAVLAITLVCTPIYLIKQRLPQQPWVMNAVLATIAFFLWAYTIGGTVFLIFGLHNVLLAGIAAPLFTFIAGAFEPRSPVTEGG